MVELPTELISLYYNGGCALLSFTHFKLLTLAWKDIESLVTRLLVSMKLFLESLVAWSDSHELEEDVYRAQEAFHEALSSLVQAFGQFNISLP